ncbi:MAG TPA: Co2+/Mg2+ efflux protein ApaG [Pseudomonadales bacterium]
MSGGFDIRVEVRYIERESDPDERRFVFAYTITISNRGERAAQLMNRYWRITNAEGRVEEVAGPGVVGKQPVIEPGTAFRYTSAAILETPVGTMEGHYEFRSESGNFRVPIAPFRLSQPNVVH